MTEKKTTLTRQEYLIALALFTLGQQAYAKGIEGEEALVKVLGRDDRSDLGHLSDEMYSPDKGFDKALELEGFTVLPE